MSGENHGSSPRATGGTARVTVRQRAPHWDGMTEKRSCVAAMRVPSTEKDTSGDQPL